MVSEVRRLQPGFNGPYVLGLSGGPWLDNQTSKLAWRFVEMCCGPQSFQDCERNLHGAVRYKASTRFQVSVIHLNDMIFFNTPADNAEPGFYEGPRGWDHWKSLNTIRAELEDESVLLVIIEGYRAFAYMPIVELMHLLACVASTIKG